MKILNNIKKFVMKHIYFISIILTLLLYILYIQRFELFESNAEAFKYKICLLSQFKNETMNLKIWIEHYLNQGVEHIYLIDNGSDDNPMEILKPYIDKGIVTYHSMPEKHQQMKHIIEVIEKENLKNITEWLIICDLDEFFYGVPNKLSKTIDEYNQYDVIYSNWQMFGSDGLKNHPFNILKSIFFREPELHILTKYIYKPKNIDLKNDNTHVHTIENCSNPIVENDKIRLNHYPIQSEDFFRKVKMTRGDINRQDVENIRDMKYFNDYDKNKTVKDDILANITAEYDSL